MNTEKIAFLYPYHETDDDAKAPMLLMETDDLPVTTNMSFQIHFLGLVHEKEYWVSACILKEEGDLEVSISGDKGVWIRAKGYKNSHSTLATSLSLHFDACKFEAEGDYLIRVSISKDGEVIHDALAYFSVSKVVGG